MFSANATERTPQMVHNLYFCGRVFTVGDQRVTTPMKAEAGAEKPPTISYVLAKDARGRGGQSWGILEGLVRTVRIFGGGVQLDLGNLFNSSSFTKV